jgi:DNA-binding NarL/FixJ family response regulator
VPPVRVAVVDDSLTVRLLLRTVLSLDDRFEVVGEAEDGLEAIELAEALQPDLMVLDRDMPRLDGVRAIPRIRLAAPRCAIVLFTAASDAGTHQAAMSAGASEVLPKSALGPDIVDALGGALVGHLAELGATLVVRVGPVAAGAARVWIDNTRRIVAALRRDPDVLDEPVTDEVLDLFERFLGSWHDVVAVADQFSWQARAAPDDVRLLLEQWAAIDRMTDEQLDRLGVSWAPPEAEPFWAALTEGVVLALQEQAATQDLAAALADQWSVPVARQPPTSPT